MYPASLSFDASRNLRIKDPGAIHFGKGREDMYPGASWANDLLATDSPNQQGIRDQRAMTAPWHGFGAHYYDPALAHQLDQSFDGLIKFCRLHIICISTARSISPAGVDRIASRSTQTAKFRHVRVANGGGLQ